jgi:tetratricopeptide (TPR) repeat protein
MIPRLHLITHSLVVLLTLLVSQACSKEAQKGRSLERAKGFVEAGEYEKAKIEYMSVLQKEPTNAEAFRQLGKIWAEQGAGVPAVRYLSRAAEAEELPADLRLKLARGLLGLGGGAKAREQALAILQKDPSNGEALTLLAEAVVTPEDGEATLQALDAFPDKNSAHYHLAMVPMHWREKRPIEAEEAAAKAVAADPKLPAAHLAVGLFRERAKDIAGAGEAFAKAAELAPARSSERLRYADFLTKQGKRDEAQALVAEVLKQAPDYVPAWISSAQMAASRGQHDEAMGMLDKAFAIDADNLGGRLLQASIHLAKNEPAKAVEVLERLSDMFNSAPMIRMQLARARVANRDLAGSAVVLEELQAEGGEQALPATLMLAEVNLRRGDSQAVVQSMRTLLEQKDPPPPTVAAVLLAQAYEIENRLPEAIQVVRGLILNQPKEVRHHRALAELFVRSGQAEEAKQAYEKVLELVPDEPEALTRLVELDLGTRQLPAAEKRVAELQTRAPQSVLARLLAARIAIASQDMPRAEKALQETLALDPANAEAHDLMVRIFVSTNRRDEAVKKVDEILARTPDDARALRQKAILAGEQGEHAKAAEAYEKLINVLPSPDAFVLNNLAVLCADNLNQLDRAFDLATQARALRPSVSAATTPQARIEAAAVADTLGWLSYRRGAYAQALGPIQEAAAVFKDNAEILYHQGLAAAAMGDLTTARQSLSQAAASPTPFAGIETAKLHLKLLGGAEGEPATPSGEIQALLEKSPEDLVLRWHLAAALDRENKSTEAAAAYAAVFQKNPSMTQAARRLAELHADMDQPEKALEFARAARQLAPNDPAVAGVLGRLVFQSGDHALAYNLLREATSGPAREPATLAALARAAYSLGKVDESRTLWQDVVGAKTDAALTSEGTAFLALTSPDAPVTAAEQALATDSKNVPALMLRAAARFAAGDSASAIADSEAALAVYPSFAPAKKTLARILAASPDTRERAFELATQARQALPDDPDLAETLGQLAAQRKDHRFAVQLFSEVVRSRPLTPTALLALGSAHAALGDQAAARDAVTQAVTAGLPEAEAAEAAALLETLKEGE